MDGMNQNNNPYGQQNDGYQINNMNQLNPYQQQENYGMQMTYPNTPEKKKGNGVKIAVGISCALVALIGIGIGALAYYRNTPSYKINKGLHNLALEIVQTKNPLAEKIGIEDILLMMQEEGSHVETKLNVPVDVPMIGNTTVGVDTDFYKDVPGKELSADTSFSVMNWDIAHLNIYANDEVICFSVPELFLEDLYIENENVISQYNDSIWSELFSPSDMEDFSIELFPDADERISIGNLKNMSTIVEDFEDDFDVLRDGMTIGKVEAGIYRVTFPSKETDRLLKNLLENYARMYDEVDALQELKRYEKLVDSDVSLLLEIDGTNRIECIMLESPVEILDGKVSLEGELFFLGETRSIDKMQGKIAVDGFDGQSWKVLWQIQMSSDDTVYRMDMDLKWTKEEETIGKMKFIVNCDAVDDEFDITFSAKDETDNMEFVLEGSVDDIEKGESVEVDLDQVAVSVNGEELFKVTGDVSIEPLEKTIRPSAEPETAFFEMTDSDLMVILYRLDDEYGGILGSLLGQSLFDNLW